MNLHQIDLAPIGDRIIIHEYLAARYTEHEWRTTPEGDWQHRRRGRTAVWMTLTFQNAQRAYLDDAIRFRETGRIRP